MTLRFPQEALNAADLFTGAFLALAGALALGISFGMGERLRSGRVTRTTDARSVRMFFALAGVGLVWLGFDEVFLVHEFLSANLHVGDSWILLGYAAVAGFAVIAWQRVLRSSGRALAVLLAGALFHGTSLGLDFVQDPVGWTPEEPLEMIGAGLYALAMATYATRLVLSDALLSMPVPRVQTAVADLPASAIEPLSAPASAPADPSWAEPAWTTPATGSGETAWTH